MHEAKCLRRLEAGERPSHPKNLKWKESTLIQDGIKESSKSVNMTNCNFVKMGISVKINELSYDQLPANICQDN